MSGLAEILLKEGFRVSGSDSKESPLTQHLTELGAQIAYPQAAANIPDDTKIIVYTAAIHPDNPEFIRAKELDVPMLTRAQLLGQIMAHYARSIAVAGTHGKTTTTSMISQVLLCGQEDPTISVGGILKAIGSNIHVGNSDLFITEACEYTNSYHSFFPKYSIILNIEAEHLDFFKDLADVRSSFHKFAGNTKAGGALIDNMSWLFAVGVAVGMAQDNDGTAGLAGLVSMYMITTLLSSGAVAGITGKEAAPAFGKIVNQFVGILSGLIGSYCYNKYRTVKLPDALAFFSGKRAVAIFTALYSIVAALILFFIWPLVYGGLVSMGEAFIGMGAIGAGIYAFFNRLLIPFGLHHALNSVFWFDVAEISDLSNFWGNTGVYGQTGMYMTGFFPFMMFGLPAACLAMYKTAKPGKKKMVYGLLASAAFCSFFTGVTEPIEFSFMFLAPGLYVVHALLAGVTAAITVALPIRAGFSFSGGAVDMVLSSFTPLAENPWLLIPVGLAVGVLYYVVFTVVITKFNLKTPGREDDDADELKVTLANDDYTAVAKIVLEGVGGASNVTSIDNCITRLRLEIKDYTKVDEKVIKSAGVAGVIRPSKTSVQVIIGTQVQFVADEFKKLCK